MKIGKFPGTEPPYFHFNPFLEGGGAQWGILEGHGGVTGFFFTILLLTCICLVFHVENGQNEYIHLQTLYE